jgi:hypothetical protein
MSTLIDFPFQDKEGKYFVPIVSQEDTYKVSGGAVVADSTKLVAGIKGAFVKIKFILPAADAETKKELFATNTESVYSSN